MRPVDPIRPVPGMVLNLADDQYEYGLGPIVCRVIEVFGETLVAEMPGWHILGECRPQPPMVVARAVVRELYVIGTAIARR